MAEHQVMVCHDCKVQRDIDKLHCPQELFIDEYDLSYFDDKYTRYWAMSLLEFVERHEGHDITMAGEYGGTEDLWMDNEYDYEKNPFEWEGSE